MEFVYNDGGREAAGFKGRTGDCVVRSIAIVTCVPYAEAYHALHAGMRAYAASHRDRVARRLLRRTGGTSPRNGVHKEVYRPYLEGLGWEWTPAMRIGSGCRVHLRAAELPAGRLIVCVSRHVTAVIEGVIHDTHDPSRDGMRCVYGYWRKAERKSMSVSIA